MNDIRLFLSKVLDAIEYKNNKDTFISEFEKNLQMLYLLELNNSLPDEKQEELKKQLTESQNNPENIKNILNNFFTPEEIQKTIEKNTTETFSEYIQTIAPTLSETQLHNLEKVFKEMGQPPAQISY